MTKTHEVESLGESVLKQSQEALGVTWAEQDGRLIARSYGDSHREYRSIRQGQCGIIDISSRARVRVSGSEAAMFLNGLITNDMKTLESGHWMPAVFPNVQGRLIASVRVAHLGDETVGGKSTPIYLLDTEAATHKQLVKLIERFTMAGDFHVADITEETTMLTIQGPASATLIDEILEPVSALPCNGVTQLVWKSIPLTIIRATHTGEDGFDIVVENAHANSVWKSFIAAGVSPVGADAIEILRIEAGIPLYGADMDDSNVVTETNLDDAISYTKGCYVGQEIIVRIKHRGHVAKKLSGLVSESNAPIASGSALYSMEGREIGRITSATLSPQLEKYVALGYVRYEHSKPGEILKTADSTEVKVHELPVVRGSWSRS